MNACERQARDQRDADARRDEALHGLVVVALERRVRLESGRQARAHDVARARARRRRLHPVLIAQVGERQRRLRQRAGARRAARRASGPRAASPSAARSRAARARRGTRTAARGRTRRPVAAARSPPARPRASVSDTSGWRRRKLADRERHQRRAGRRERGDPQTAAADAENRGRDRPRPPRPGRRSPPRARRASRPPAVARHPAAVADDERRPGLRFEPRDGLRDGRLRVGERLRGGRERAPRDRPRDRTRSRPRFSISKDYP